MNNSFNKIWALILVTLYSNTVPPFYSPYKLQHSYIARFFAYCMFMIGANNFLRRPICYYLCVSKPMCWKNIWHHTIIMTTISKNDRHSFVIDNPNMLLYSSLLALKTLVKFYRIYNFTSIDVGRKYVYHKSQFLTPQQNVLTKLIIFIYV